MNKFYFTYGTESYHPFYGGWSEVYAENMKQACDLFRAAHPDTITDILNCAGIYSEKRFKETKMYRDGNFGYRCHEIIGTFRPVEKELKDLSNLSSGPFSAVLYIGAIELASCLGLFSESELYDLIKPISDYNRKKKLPDNTGDLFEILNKRRRMPNDK